MKKLKALEILKDHIIDLENMALIFEEYCMYKSRDETNKAIQELTEAIDELEALEDRSCRNCKFVFSDTLGLIYCSSPKSPLSSCVFPIHPNFSCNKWEVKNES